MKKNFLSTRIKKILPSKRFARIMLFSTSGAILILIIFFVFSGKSTFISKNKKSSLDNKNVLELIQADTDADSIPDWEEALWGTDKNNKKTFDVADVIYIENKKKELRANQEGEYEANSETETDKFAKEFFSAYTALKATGEADNTTINSFSNALGQKIINPALIDSYKEENVLTTDIDSYNEGIRYYQTLQSLYETYTEAGIGDELDIVSQGLLNYSSSGTSNNYEELLLIGEAYQNFAQKVMETEVPKSLIKHHLKIANAANNTGISVLNMQDIIVDPIVGLSGLSQYQKYSDDLVNAVADLDTALEN